MIVTSQHDLIAIVIATSVPPGEQNQSFLSGCCHRASITKALQYVDNCKTAPFLSLTSSGRDRECNVISDVAWLVSRACSCGGPPTLCRVFSTE